MSKPYPEISDVIDTSDLRNRFYNLLKRDPYFRKEVEHGNFEKVCEQASLILMEWLDYGSDND